MISRRAFLGAFTAVVATPHLALARPVFGLAIAQPRVSVSPHLEISLQVDFWNDSAQAAYVQTGCGSVFDILSLSLEQNGQRGSGMPARVQRCSPSLPQQVALSRGMTRQTMSFVTSRPWQPTGLRIHVVGGIEGRSLRSNTLTI